MPRSSGHSALLLQGFQLVVDIGHVVHLDLDLGRMPCDQDS